MTMYVYHAEGHPVGFLFSSFVHDLEGNPLGRILGSHVYRLDGTYVGEFYKQTVVDKPILANVRNIAPIRVPEKLESPGSSFSRRGLVNYGYSDVFHRLHDNGAEPLAIAAE